MAKSVSLAVLACVLLQTHAFAAGAIAVDDEEGLRAAQVPYGYVTGRESRDEAGAAALQECRHHGGEDCKVVVRFDQCGAYASSREHSGIGWGGSEDLARRKAMDDCGTDHCRIVAAVCERD
jgi:hypothetical protein